MSPILLSLICLAAVVQSQQPLYSSFFGRSGVNAEYDYVIVGGGTAGLTLATRLSEANASVAVVEAGGFYETDNGNLSVVPGYAAFYTGSDLDNFQPLIDWGISTTVQQKPIARALHYARGKTFGGSSARNFFVYQRPTVQAMQKWADEVGDDSFTWDKMLPYFKKSINYTASVYGTYTNSSITQDPDAFEPGNGPLQVSFSNAVDPLGTWVQRAFIEAGMPQTAGFSSGQLLGSAYGPLTIDPTTGERSSSESAFLQHALKQGRAPVLYKNTLATRILFGTGNSTTPQATGIQALTAGTFGTGSVNFTLSARKEVILSAGAFQSPQLLMVSGIGNCSELAAFNIACTRNLVGVGNNMWDHPIFGSAHRVQVNTASASANNPVLAAELVKLYLETQSGPLSIFGPGYYGWEKLPEPYRSLLSNSSRTALDAAFPSDWPEIEWLPQAAYSGDNSNKQTQDPKDGHNYASLTTSLVAPLSRGTVKLASSSMTTLPLVDPAWLTHPADLDLAVQSFKRQRQIWDTLAAMGVADSDEAYPGFANVQTDDEIKAWIGKSMTTVYHASGTCKMGNGKDESAVVDSKGRVFGVAGLRVVDASAFPFLTPGHPQSVVYALAEKVAEGILNETS
ncbi:putative GMC oxidoreductase [Pseudomassariella vexata]|uniref:Putative GMC oxidoreductase n=1 Tax=Pseudomassariella vexata TaxID=1141098 RepID=A0A1Y2DCL4_9PEZI|nr:putative GMC oxidoreductase [Pseudomassariella vexata]ORY57010.1 putative GMC oxidoreductase [Pseudomassariella vexata]